MHPENKPKHARQAAGNQKTPGQPVKKLLYSQLDDLGDKQVIIQSLAVKDGTLKTCANAMLLAGARLLVKIYYYIPSFTKLLEENMKGKGVK